MTTMLKNSFPGLGGTLVILLLLSFLIIATTEAGITKIVYGDPTPYIEGYELISGMAYGEVDPSHPLNGIIQDIELAPRNERGMVEYSTKFTILRPTDGGNGLLFYEVVNRGFPMTAFIFPGMASLARQRGYTIVWSGWQGDLVPIPHPLQHTMQVPVPTVDGAEITGRVRAEYVVPSPENTLDLSGRPPSPLMRHKSYETIDLGDPDAVLTRRVREADPATEVPREDWAFADCTVIPFPGAPSPTKICLKNGFDPNHLYELVYTAKNPLVLGLGLSATRDFVSFLRHAVVDGFGTPNPIAGSTRAAVMHGASQSGRFTRTFVQLGFNEDEEGRVVFEGMNAHLGPARVALNIRFGQPGSSSGQHGGHHNPGWASPFTWMPVRDHVAQRTGWTLERCRKTNTCPKTIETVSSNEYWKLRASLSTTDALGRHDRPLPSEVFMYLFSGTQHVAAATPSYGYCQQLSNPNDYRPYLRTLLVALERWVLEDEKPPPSQIPTLREGTLVSSAKASIGWPDIPGVKYTGLLNTLPLVDYGPEFNPEDESGILSEPPEVLTGLDYAVLVSKVDADGNEVAGIRSTAIEAPLGTYTGWNLRRAGFAEDELCGGTGSFIPFAETQAERLAVGDQRLSLEERYGDHQGYVDAVREAAYQLVARGYLLLEEAEEIIVQAEASNVLLP